MGAELCLAHDMGGVEAYGGPLSVDMQPYGCFILFVGLHYIFRYFKVRRSEKKIKITIELKPKI